MLVIWRVMSYNMCACIHNIIIYTTVFESDKRSIYKAHNIYIYTISQLPPCTPSVYAQGSYLDIYLHDGKRGWAIELYAQGMRTNLHGFDPHPAFRTRTRHSANFAPALLPSPPPLPRRRLMILARVRE